MNKQETYLIDLSDLNPRVAQAVKANIRELQYVAVQNPYEIDSLRVIITSRVALILAGDGDQKKQLLSIVSSLPCGKKPWSERVSRVR